MGARVFHPIPLGVLVYPIPTAKKPSRGGWPFVRPCLPSLQRASRQKNRHVGYGRGGSRIDLVPSSMASGEHCHGRKNLQHQPYDGGEKVR